MSSSAASSMFGFGSAAAASGGCRHRRATQLVAARPADNVSIGCQWLS
jgi:hypothetical protein